MSNQTKVLTTEEQISVRTLPDRNFVAGWPKNPATYIAEHDETGHYFEAFVEEYPTKAAFVRAALAYFNRS